MSDIDLMLREAEHRVFKSRIVRALLLHRNTDNSCYECHEPYPCTTVEILSGESD